MAQARNQGSTRAVDSLSDSNEKELADNQRLIERDGGVFLQTTAVVGDRERITERRVDSEGDLDHSTKGGQVWYRKLLAKQNAADKAKEEPKTNRKVAPKKAKASDDE